MEAFQNTDLLALGVVLAATIVLGFSAYISDAKSSTNRLFFLFSLVTASWGTVNYFSYQFSESELTLWLLRGIMFFATLQAFFLYALFRTFPATQPQLSLYERGILFPAVGFIAVLTLTPAVFQSVLGQAVAGSVALVQPGPGVALFGLFAVGLVVAALYQLVRKTTRARGEDRKAFTIILCGVGVTFSLIIAFNFLAAAVFQNPTFVPYGAVFMFPLVASVAYTILRHKFFNIKVAATALLVCVLAIVSFMEVIFSNDFSAILFRTSTFILVIVSGVILVRSVLREVEQRELIEVQEKELEEVNRQQESLLHFISHEIKGYLAKSEAGFASIVEGDFGETTPQLKSMATGALGEVRKGVATVMDILDASNLKKGTVSYVKKAFDFKKATLSVVEDLTAAAREKHVTIETDIADGEYMLDGDEDKIRRHVLRNLIDNAVKYTPQGSIRVSLSKNGAKIRFSVKDSGVGITPEDMKRLFTEGGHGKDSIKVNVHSTGYGLYIAKQIVEAHDGKIWAESEGEGKGAQFVVEI